MDVDAERVKGWVPATEITNWSPDGPADRPYDNVDQAKADLMALLGVKSPPATASEGVEPGTGTEVAGSAEHRSDIE